MKKQFLLPMAAACCLLVLAGCKNDKDEVKTAEAELGTIESVVEDSGTAVHRDPYTIYATVNGKILECNFEEGDHVQEGDVLYVLDSSDLEDQITQAKLTLRSASQSLSQAQKACADLTVTAKAGGTVGNVLVHVGDFVAPGTPIAEIADQQNMTVSVPFSPEEAKHIAVGSTGTITFPAFSDSTTATVKRVYDTPSGLPGGRQAVFVEFTFANPGALVGGESAVAQVGTAASMDAGQVKAAAAQMLCATQSGQILTLPISTGKAVKPGDVILTIDNSAVTNARDNAALGKETAATALSQLEARRDDFTLRAPADGVIMTRNAKAGDYAAAVNPLAILTQENSLGVDVPIDEIYIEKIFPGQTALITFTDDVGKSHTYSGSVDSIDEVGVVSGGVTDYTVSLTLDTTEQLKAGMNVTVAITTEKKENCLRLPVEAVDEDNKVRLQGDDEDDKTEEVTVKTGISGGGYIEILDGLKKGDVVVLP